MNKLKVKNRKTGEIKTVIEFFSDGCLTLVGKNGSEERVESEKDLLKKYEYLQDFDYSTVTEIAVNSCKYSREISSLFKAFARRLHKGGYFRIGDTVRLINPSLMRDGDYYYHNKLFSVVDIRPVSDDGDNSLRLELSISSFGRKDIEYKFMMYPDRIVPGDAFTSLERPDAEY